MQLTESPSHARLVDQVLVLEARGPNCPSSAWKKVVDKDTAVSIVTHRKTPNLSKNVRMHIESTPAEKSVVTAAAMTDIPMVVSEYAVLALRN